MNQDMETNLLTSALAEAAAIMQAQHLLPAEKLYALTCICVNAQEQIEILNAEPTTLEPIE